MAIEDFDSFNSQTKKGKRLENLFLYELEKEADWYRKQVEKFKKQLDDAPFNSSKQTAAARSLDLATVSAMEFQQYLVYRAKKYVPTKGFQLESSKKEIAFADKYKNVDTSVYSQTAQEINTNYKKYESGPRNVYAVSPKTLDIVDSVVSGDFTSTPAVEQTARARGGQSSMNEQQTMAAFAGLSNANKPKPKAKAEKPEKPTVPGAGTSSTVVVDGKKVKVGSEQWKTIIQQEFGSMWDVYNSNPDVKAVIDKSVKEGWFNDELKLTASLQNTGWYRTTQQSARQFAVQQSTDPANTEARINSNVESIRAESLAQGFTLNDPTLRKLATDQLKFGWSDQQRFNAIGSEVVAQSQLGGGQGMADLRQSSIGRNLRAKAATYFQKPTEDMIGTWTQQILTGQKSEVQWDELMRSSARTQFRSLQPALDRGEDVDTAMYAYKQQALATLGSSIDATQIDWTQDKWNKALNFRDEKTNEFRQMDLWEWNKYLRTLPEWKNTDEAKEVYRNVAFSLAQGFGKMA